MTADLEALIDRALSDEPKVPRCHSGRDGDCYWEDCPQHKDYKTTCPYWEAWTDYWDKEGIDYR